MFKYVLEWMRSGRIVIDCPTTEQYLQLCDDADYYGLADLHAFVCNRSNLCESIKLQWMDKSYICNLREFRRVKNVGGFMQKLLRGDPSIAYSSNGRAVVSHCDPIGLCDLLANPIAAWHRTYYLIISSAFSYLVSGGNHSKKELEGFARKYPIIREGEITPKILEGMLNGSNQGQFHQLTSAYELLRSLVGIYQIHADCEKINYFTNSTMTNVKVSYEPTFE